MEKLPYSFALPSHPRRRREGAVWGGAEAEAATATRGLAAGTQLTSSARRASSSSGRTRAGGWARRRRA